MLFFVSSKVADYLSRNTQNNEMTAEDIVSSLWLLLSSKDDDSQVQNDLVGFIGYDEIELVHDLWQRRKAIQVAAQEAKMIEQGNEKSTKNPSENDAEEWETWMAPSIVRLKSTEKVKIMSS